MSVFKVLKKIISEIMILILYATILCFTLSACVWDPADYYFEKEELTDVVSVELINYNNTERKSFKSWVPNHFDELAPFDNSKISILENLDENKIPDFIDSLCEPLILYHYFTYDSPSGICLKLSYSNGDFLIISNEYKRNTSMGYIGEYSPNGEVITFIGCFHSSKNFIPLVNDYFQTQI